MLLWINGPFGVGKTHTAHELARRLPGSTVSDPELLGFGIHRMLPRALRDDFQDFPAWRRGVCEVLDHLLRHHDGPVVVPMTLVVPQYFEETVGALRAGGHEVRHVTLLAERETVLRRLRGRRPLPGLPADRWAAGQLDRCLTALRGPEFAEHVHTDNLPLPRAAEAVADAAGLRIAPPTGGALRQRMRRARTTLRSIRFD
ncbi:AAA family ATPase [Streptomyces sp. TRM 70361]|uniref:AAA family ATPase n=1 Tax=Streptomyces sp. TRM 70361 TaxID=3116553 RepID=UPI002E7B0CA0|nr:AAA family ATPase [Streptomyces sp. TRM 70361]MEE1941069.1 AAA family ATPase [Streptomyces sp. TRM 70361]